MSNSICGPIWGRVSLSLLTLMLSSAVAAAEATTLVRDGVGRACIVLRPDAGEQETLAAKELVEHIKRMSGVELPTVNSAAQARGVKILIGRAVPAAYLSKVQAEAPDSMGSLPVSFRLRVSPKIIELAGLSESGTLYAAYELLEQLGIRWFMPGEIGTVIPARKTVAVEQQDTIQHPGFAGRHLGLYDDGGKPSGDWARHMRMGGFGTGGCHGYKITVDYQKEPELSYVDHGRRMNILKISHPEVIRRVIAAARQTLKNRPDLRYLPIGPEDAVEFGEDGWDAGDYDPLHGRVSITDRLIKFYNIILEDIQRDYPDVGIAFYAYSLHMRPPVREKPNPKILPVLAPISVCRIHAIDNKLCWERQYIDQIVQGWKTLGLKMMYRGYLFNFADQGLPFSMINQIRAEYPYYYRQGMVACSVECKAAWGYHAPSLYLAAKIMWNPQLDTEALLEDYFAKLYGPAAQPMRKHFEIVEEAYAQGDYHTGNVFDIPKILTPEVMARMDKTLWQAERAVPEDSIYAERVRMVRIGYEYGAANLAMMKAINDFDFVQAKKQLDLILNDIAPKAVAHKPCIINTEYGSPGRWGFIYRFWQRTVEQGLERVSGGNEIVVKLPDTWLMILDPYDGGEKLGLWKPGLGEQPWRPMQTYSQSWSNQGLRYYKGVAWYKTIAEVPIKYLGRKIRLWLAGVDDKAQAWINGRPLELISSGTAPMGIPWEFDADRAIDFGQNNTIVIRVSNQYLYELGTGGLTMPAMLWAERTSGDN